jgi:hypothetical protein
MFAAFNNFLTGTFSPLSLGPLSFFDASNPASYPGSGTSITDLSGNSNGGTLMNGAGFTSSDGGAFSLDGVNDFIEIPAFSSGSKLSGLSAFSASIFVKSSSTQCAYFSYSGAGQNASDILFAVSGGVLFVQINNGADGTASVTFSIPSTFFNVSMVFDGSASGNANRLKLYVNGIIQTLTFGAYTVPATTGSPTTPLSRIGSYGAFPASWWVNGSIASSIFFNRSITQDEVTRIFNWGRTRLGI